jgi:carboxypeptidase D
MLKPYNLKGLLIGNGWISGVDQYPSYRTFALSKGILVDGTEEAKNIDTMENNCMRLLSDGGKDHVDTQPCERILTEILSSTAWEENGQLMCRNMYDVRLKDTSPSCGMNWPPDLATVTPYLRRQDVMDALHINREHRNGWQECNGAVGSAFQARNSAPSVTLLPDILAQIPVVLFSGDQDLICNHLGTEALINNLEFNGAKGFEISPGTWAPRRKWTFDGQPAGFYQEARNLIYVLFYNSSHMVPFDLPRQSRDMVDRFMRVDVSYIGGEYATSLIDGEEVGPPTVVGGTPNSTAAKAEQGEKIQSAVNQAYRKSGEVALVIVAIAAAVWGFFVCRARRRRSGYRGVFSSDPDEDGGMNGRVRKRMGRPTTDLEAAAAFDENELDDLGSTESEEGGDSGGGEKGVGNREEIRHVTESGTA